MYTVTVHRHGKRAALRVPGPGPGRRGPGLPRPLMIRQRQRPSSGPPSLSQPFSCHNASLLYHDNHDTQPRRSRNLTVTGPGPRALRCCNLNMLHDAQNFGPEAATCCLQTAERHGGAGRGVAENKSPPLRGGQPEHMEIFKLRRSHCKLEIRPCSKASNQHPRSSARKQQRRGSK